VTKALAHLVVLGDSVAQGLGAMGRSFPELLARQARAVAGHPVELVNLAGTATTVAESLAVVDAVVALSPSIVIVHHGITEGLVRPRPAVLRFMPRRWRRPGWMDPRPFFSSRWPKRLAEKADSALRWRVKTATVRVWGGTTCATAADFERDLERLTARLEQETHALVVLLTHCGADERYFKGSNAALERCRAATERVAARHAARVLLCDVTNVCHRWDDYLADHMHPNAHGHEVIAAALADLLGHRQEFASRG
jgi:lysophospholipase L1-like esterase